MSGASRLHGINVAVGSGCGTGTGVSGRGMLQDKRRSPVTRIATARLKQGDKLRIVMASSVD
jgi:hypothetical protein